MVVGNSTVWCHKCGEPFDPRKEGNWKERLCGKDKCPEHNDNKSDSIESQHHSPEDHVGNGPCKCPIYQTKGI